MCQPFWLNPNFREKNREIFEKWAYFSRKILENGYTFLSKSPLKMGMDFEAWAAHPCPTQIWVPPPVLVVVLCNGQLLSPSSTDRKWPLCLSILLVNINKQQLNLAQVSRDPLSVTQPLGRGIIVKCENHMCPSSPLGQSISGKC